MRPIIIVLLAIGPVVAEERVDLAGDPLPQGAISRIGTTRYRIREWHQQVFLTPDGMTVIAKGEGNLLKFWESVTGKLLGEVRDSDVYDFTADLAPDGKSVAIFGTARSDKPPTRL